MDSLEKPKLKRSDGEGLEVSVKQVAGGRLQGNFTIEEQIEQMHKIIEDYERN